MAYNINILGSLILDSDTWYDCQLDNYMYMYPQGIKLRRLCTIQRKAFDNKQK